MLCYALSMGKKAPKSALSPQDFVTLPEEDWTTAIGNTHRKIGKDRTCGSGDMPQTDRQTDVLITILCHHSHGQSNKSSVNHSQTHYELVGDLGGGHAETDNVQHYVFLKDISWRFHPNCDSETHQKTNWTKRWQDTRTLYNITSCHISTCEHTQH